jgi:NodT family efflux transporter outer membrane factor (OMF) lipoprotein
VLIGHYPDAGIDLSPGLPAPAGAIPAGLPAEVVARRPDLVAAERRLAGALAGVKGAKRALYPRISLTASGGTSSNQLRDLVKGDFAVWGLAANILQPIFQGGRLRAAVDLARARSDAALAGYALSVLNAFAEVETALAAEEYLREQEAALREATEQARAARRLAEEQYGSGVRNLLTLLEAQRAAYDTESRLLTVERQRLDTRVDLHLALGGDFPPAAPAGDPTPEPSSGVPD